MATHDRDELITLCPVLFPDSKVDKDGNTLPRCKVFALAAMRKVFIVYYIELQYANTDPNRMDPFIFVLGFKNVEQCDPASPQIRQYKLLLQTFTTTCMRENFRCGFLSKELARLKKLRDMTDDWTEFNHKALLETDMAQEIKSLVDGINKPGADAIHVKVNGHISMDFPLPKVVVSPTPALTPRRSPCFASTHLRTCDPAKTTLILDETFDFAEDVAQQFQKVHMRYDFYDTISFFQVAQTIEAYFERLKKTNKRAAKSQMKTKDHLQWLMEHKVLKIIQPHYLLLYSTTASVSGVGMGGYTGGGRVLRVLRPEIATEGTPSLSGPSPSSHPSILYCTSTEGTLQPPLNLQVLPHDHTLQLQVPQRKLQVYSPTLHLHDDDHRSRAPPKTLEISEKDWQGLLGMVKDQLRVTFEYMCDHNLLDGKHTRNEIIHHGVREQLLDQILHVFNGHILTVWF